MLQGGQSGRENNQVLGGGGFRGGGVWVSCVTDLKRGLK